LSAPVL